MMEKSNILYLKPPPDDRGIPTLDQLDDFFIGDLEEHELCAMFQPMIDSGVIWHMRIDIIYAAVTLLRYGICTPQGGPK